MEHRHLSTRRWTAAAVDSPLERGGLADAGKIGGVIGI